MASILAGLLGAAGESVIPSLLQSLATGAATSLGTGLMKKIVGDEPENDMQTLIYQDPANSGAQVLQSYENPSTQKPTMQQSPTLTQRELEALTSYLSATPNEKQYLTNLAKGISLASSERALPLQQPALNQYAAQATAARLPATILMSDAAEQQEAGRGMINTRANPTQLQSYQNLAPAQLQPLSSFGPQSSRLALGSNQLSDDLAVTIPRARLAISETPQAQWPMKTKTNQQTIITHRTLDSSRALPYQRSAVNPRMTLEDGSTPTPGQIANIVNNNKTILSDEMRNLDFGKNVRDTGRGLGNQFVNIAGNTISKGIQEQGGKLVAKGVNMALNKGGSVLQKMGSALLHKIVGDAPEGINITGESPQQKVVGDDFQILGKDPRQKIVGDSFLSNIPLIGGLLDKIVGDAPEDNASGDERTAALSVMSSSVLASLYAALIRKEQLLTPDVNFAYGTNLAGAAQQELNEFNPLRGVFNGSNYAYGVYLPGQVYDPNEVPYYNAAATPPAWELMRVPLFRVTRTHVRYGQMGPPLFGNIQYNMLKPLLAGASISEFASTLRVKITTTNVDDMVHAMGNSDVAVESMTGYSFCLPMAKLMGYILQLTSRPGTEMAEVYCGAYFRYDLQTPPPFVTFPFYTDVPRSNTMATRANWDQCTVAWATAKEYIQIMNGWASNVDSDLRYDTFDSQTAVVFIRTAEMEDGMTNAIRILSKIQYPYRTFTRVFEAYEIGSNANNLIPIPGVAPAAIPNIGLSQIDGPTIGILLVVVDKWDRTTSDNVTVGTGTGTLQLTDTDGPATPLKVAAGSLHPMVAALDSALINPNVLQMLLKEIAIQEDILGNNSDRVSAMRWCAEHYCVFRQKEQFYYTSPGGNNNIDLMRPVATNPSNTLVPTWVQAFSPLALLDQQILSSYTNTESPFGMRSNVMSTDGLTINTPSNSAAKTTSSLNSTLSCVEFLVWRGWLQPQEERSSRPIQDASNFTSIIHEMAVIIRGITDIAAQWCDVDFVSHHWPADMLQFSSNATHLIDGWFPVIRDLPTVGVQVPQFHIHPEGDINYLNLHTTALSTGAMQTNIATFFDANGPLITVCHVDWAILGKWAPALLFNDPTVTLRGMDVGQILVSGAPLFQAKLRAEMTHDRWVIAHLSMHAWATNTQLNPHFGYYMQDIGTLTDSFWPFVGFDTTIAWMMAHSQLQNAISLPSTDYIGRPNGTFPVVRNFKLAGAPVSLVSTGPRELYNSPTGTTSVQLFVVAHGIISTLASNLWRDYGPELYSPMTLGSLMNMI